jgi:hypothetical protein
MNDLPTAKNSDADIVNALLGIKAMQHDIRRGGKCWAPDLLRYYKELPREIQKRLTELSPRNLAFIERMPGGIPPDQVLQELTCDAAFEQVIRAANVYLERCGRSLMGPDGWAAKEASDGNEEEEAHPARESRECSVQERDAAEGHPSS